MGEAVWAAIISGFSSLFVCVLTNKAQAKKTELQHEKTIAIIEYKLEELSEKIEKHSNLVESTYSLESEEKLHLEKIKVVTHRIDDLEEGVKKIENKLGC